jgi:hypothetical protein
MIWIIVGIVLMLAAMWLFPFVYFTSYGLWWYLPAIYSTIFSFVVGGVMVIVGAVTW